jgi:PAS domain S-box-containing protein
LKKAAEKGRERSSDMTKEAKRAKILIVDDEPLSIDLIAHILGRDYEVLAATNGDDAIEISTKQLPDLILLDVSLPKKDGYEVCRLLKSHELTSDIPVIFITGLEGDGFEKKALELGAADFILKPMDPGMVRLRVRNNIELKLHRDELKSANEYNRSLIEASLDPLVTIGHDGKITDVNRATEKVTGAPREELIGREFSDYFTDPEKAKTGFQRVFMEGSVHDYELEIMHRNGRVVPVLYNASVYRDTAGNIGGVFAAARDISERRNLEQQLRQSQKMEAIGTLTGGIAHEFNNIMTAVIGYGSLLKLKLSRDGELLSKVDALLSAADRAAVLVRSLLSFSRKQGSDLRSIDLNGFISQLVEMIRRLIREDIHLDVSPADCRLTIKADSNQIEQVLVNLVNNSQDAMPNGGTISIDVGPADLDESFIETHGFGIKGRYALINFSDTGQGMEEETRRKIFEPFFTTKEVGKGTGLGLSICYGIIKQHEGYIICESETGKGTRFSIYLPLIPPEEEKCESKTDAQPKGGNETILIAEDNDDVREVAMEILKDYGYKVIGAIDGKDALAKFCDYRNEISLVIMDVIMPRMNGRELFSEIYRLKPGTKVIFSSGYTSDVLPEEMKRMKGYPFLSKPFVPEKLLRCVRDLLDEKG